MIKQSEIKIKREHGVETFYAFFRGILIDEFQTKIEAENAIDKLNKQFTRSCKISFSSH